MTRRRVGHFTEIKSRDLCRRAIWACAILILGSLFDDETSSIKSQEMTDKPTYPSPNGYVIAQKLRRGPPLSTGRIPMSHVAAEILGIRGLNYFQIIQKFGYPYAIHNGRSELPGWPESPRPYRTTKGAIEYIRGGVPPNAVSQWQLSDADRGKTIFFDSEGLAVLGIDNMGGI